jgi:hypothetical protein
MMRSTPDSDDGVGDAFLSKGNKGKLRPFKTPRDNRDKLLFELVDITPPEQNLGMYRLDPQANTGDVICIRMPYEGTEEADMESFVIEAVSYHYKYIQGKYRMVHKSARVKGARRKLDEAYLQQMLEKR